MVCGVVCLFFWGGWLCACVRLCGCVCGVFLCLNVYVCVVCDLLSEMLCGLCFCVCLCLCVDVFVV